MEKRFNIYEIIDEIRTRGIAMFVGEANFSYLVMFLGGCSMIARQFGIEEDELPPFHDFHAWTAKRLKFPPGGQGYRMMILQMANRDEKLALDIFYELITEFRNQSR